MIKEIGQLKNDRTKCKSNQTTFMPLTSFFALLDNPQPHWKKTLSGFGQSICFLGQV
jgi:hypothetical protein